MKFPVGEVPVLTVALPVFNGGNVLEQAVRSVLNQSWSNWELLLLDDGSTDNAIERLAFLNDPRIVVVRDGRNRGLASRLNQAIDMAKGEYFARMDHDDISHQERFLRQITFLNAHPHIDLLATQCLTMDECGRLVGRLPCLVNHVDICRRPWQGFYMAHPSWMGRTEWFRRHFYQDPAPYCCEDQELLLRAHYSSVFHTLPENLLSYRVRNRTAWKKLFLTRVSMCKMKILHFLGRKELANVFLSLIVDLARIFCDGYWEVHHKLGLQPKGGIWTPPSPQECQEWEGVIKKIKSPVERSNRN